MSALPTTGELFAISINQPYNCPLSDYILTMEIIRKVTWATNVTDMPPGSFRSLAGYAAEQAFIARAMKAGFSLFFKAWRDLEYDAVLDAKGTLFRIEVKSSSGTAFDFTRGGRGGIQIDRSIDKTRGIDKSDCDFVVGVKSGDFTCFIVPVEIIEILGRKSVSMTYLDPFCERWDLFLGGQLRFPPTTVKAGFRIMDESSLDQIICELDIPSTSLESPYTPNGTKGLHIENPRDIKVARIWEHLGGQPDV